MARKALTVHKTDTTRVNLVHVDNYPPYLEVQFREQDPQADWKNCDLFATDDRIRSIKMKALEECCLERFKSTTLSSSRGHGENDMK